MSLQNQRQPMSVTSLFVISREYGETRTGDEEVPKKSELDALYRPLLFNMAAVSAL